MSQLCLVFVICGFNLLGYFFESIMPLIMMFNFLGVVLCAISFYFIKKKLRVFSLFNFLNCLQYGDFSNEIIN